MSGGHAKRLTIRLEAAWRLYTRALPGWRVRPQFERGEGDVGALARSPQGIYQQANASVCRSLDQRKVKAALAATETKPLDYA